jgi:putative MFS transporter
LISFLVDSNLGRKWVLAISTLGSSCCLYIFTVDTSSQAQWIVSCVFQFLGNCMWGTLYTYTTEVYPTALRTIGFGFSASIGRVAGATAPVISGFLIEKDLYIALHVSSSILILTGLLMIFLPLETRGQGIH